MGLCSPEEQSTDAGAEEESETFFSLSFFFFTTC